MNNPLNPIMSTVKTALTPGSNLWAATRPGSRLRGLTRVGMNAAFTGAIGAGLGALGNNGNTERDATIGAGIGAVSAAAGFVATRGHSIAALTRRGNFGSLYQNTLLARFPRWL